MHDTHTLAEWAAFLSLGLSMASAMAVPFVLLVEADHWAWPNLQPLAHRVTESGRVDPLLLVVGPAWAAACDAARDLAALIVLLTTSPKGAMA
jgi:hypothetical protein